MPLVVDLSLAAGAMLVALMIDAMAGWPPALFARIGHPVTWIGALIALLDRRWNRAASGASARRAAGLAAALLVIAIATGAGWIAAQLAAASAGRVAKLAAADAGATERVLTIVLTGAMGWPLIAARSLWDHVAAVARPLAAGDLSGARAAVAMIVGRDPAQLDRAGVARAALESLAENASDGVIAPLFWGALFGLPGLAGYKAVNTLDSMIGHRTPRHEAFGWAAARIDDLANLIPARLTGALIAAVSGRPGAALAAMRRDARAHRSPNAGWPEAAMAGALGVRLSGPRAYAGRVSAEPWVNGAGRDPDARDLAAGLRIYRRSVMAMAVLIGAGLVMI